MTDKKLHFPSMDEGGKDDDSSDFFYQNESGVYEPFRFDSEGDEWDALLGDDETGDGETDNDDSGGDHPGDSILAGERFAYNRAKELTAGDEGDFQYFPADTWEETNRKFAMQHLQKEWGVNVGKNLGVSRFFLKNFLEENLIREADHTGIGSHPIMILAFYKAARAMERHAGSMGAIIKAIKFKNMNQIML